MEDVAPILLQKIESDFRKQYENDSEIKELLEQLENGMAKHAEAYSYAGKVGGILADSYADNLSSAVLPEGKMWYNIGSRVIIPTMEENYKYISDYVSEVQEKLNQAAGIGIKPIVPPENKDRVKGIIDRLSSEDDFDKVAWILSDPVKTLAKSIVDDSIKANAEFHCKSGMQPKIIRKSSGKCCKWCNEVAGTYYYPDVPDDVYRRHENCDCVVEYDPRNGKRQNVHTKKWENSEGNEIEYRKIVGLEQNKKMLSSCVEDVTSEYIRYANPNQGLIEIEDRVEESDIKTAEWLKKIFGGKIRVLRESGKQGIKMPDAYWDGMYWEFKSTSSSNSIDERIRKAATQLQETLERNGIVSDRSGMVIDISRRTMDIQDAVNIIVQRIPRRAKGNVDVIIKDGENLIKVIRYAKE